MEFLYLCFSQWIACQPGCKPLSGGSRAQNSPEQPDYFASSAGYITLKLFMSCAFIITVIAASVGLLSGLWLCYPTAAQNPHSLAWVADPPWKSTEGMTSLAIAQSAQYSVGGLLLVAAFVLQVLAALAPQATIQSPNPILPASLYAVAAIVALVSLVVLVPLSFVAYRWRVKAMHRQVQTAAAHLEKFPRLTPLP